jgi:glycosyltransferase involved in cell wall biosynthesis
VESLTNIWKDAPVFTLADFLNDEDRRIILKGKRAETTFIQKLPFASGHFRKYLVFFPFAIEQLDVSGYDVVISSSHAVAKGVLTGANQLHISYCHTPIRYAWDLYHQYLRESNLQKGIAGLIAKKVLHYMRIWDSSTANRPDYFIANSRHIAKRIRKTYNREAAVIYPPVDVDKFQCDTVKDNYYITVSRMVPYKKIDMIVEAFAQMPDKKLVVIGDGPEMLKVKSKATPNIEILGHQPFETLKQYMQKAKAFVFAAEEDFGIVVVEAMACGTPVIAWSSGGTKETIVAGETGIFFDEQTPQSLMDAVNKFETSRHRFNPSVIRAHSKQFSREVFEENIKNFVEQKTDEHFSSAVRR